MYGHFKVPSEMHEWLQIPWTYIKKEKNLLTETGMDRYEMKQTEQRVIVKIKCEYGCLLYNSFSLSIY